LFDDFPAEQVQHELGNDDDGGRGQRDEEYAKDFRREKHRYIIAKILHSERMRTTVKR